MGEKKAEQVKEVPSMEADAPVEVAEGKTSEEPVASTEDKVAELETVAAAEAAPVTNSPSATPATEEKAPVEAVVEAAEEKPEEPMETESSPTDSMETKSDPPAAAPVAEVAPEWKHPCHNQFNPPVPFVLLILWPNRLETFA